MEALLHEVGVLRLRWRGRSERSPNQAKSVFHSSDAGDLGFGAEGDVTQLEKEESGLVKSVVAEESETHQEFQDEWTDEPNHRGSQTVGQSRRVEHHGRSDSVVRSVIFLHQVGLRRWFRKASSETAFQVFNSFTDGRRKSHQCCVKYHLKI
ncbi:hypothetical protein V8G54_002872 [Vigna mungo]|uniref:Uncharacterized protein n=1 Tax=Vigna mungo TaxID=3915 RepID=A0AAQ3PA03_VIGMU